jgi:hypothetical protein
MGVSLSASFALTSEHAHRVASHPDAFLELRRQLHQRLCTEVDPEFFPKWKMEPSPLIVDGAELQSLFTAALAFHDAIEALLDNWYAGESVVCKYFQRYEIFRGLISKPGRLWQGWGRCDMLTRTDGSVCFIETNAAMASGGLPNHYLARYFDYLAQGDLRPQQPRGWMPQYDESGAGELVRRLEPNDAAALAILVDENRKFHESGMLETTLRAAGRSDIIVGDVADVAERDGALHLEGHRLSTVFNKFRLFGEQHHWSPKAFDHNQPFLDAVRRGLVMPINCLAAQTIAEDKVIFAALRDPRFMSRLSQAQQQAIIDHTEPTAALETESQILIDDVEHDLEQLLIDQRGDWIIKPRNDYRGSGVVCGRDQDASSWTALIDQRSSEIGRWVAQRRVDAMTLNAAVADEDQVRVADLRLASGVYMIGGIPYGLVARAGTGEVVNGITGAHMLPIWAGDRTGYPATAGTIDIERTSAYG